MPSQLELNASTQIFSVSVQKSTASSSPALCSHLELECVCVCGDGGGVLCLRGVSKYV